jgi:hypothetical protein
VAGDIAASIPGRQARLGRPVPEDWLAIAGSLAHELGASAGDRLVHADLHYRGLLGFLWVGWWAESAWLA